MINYIYLVTIKQKLKTPTKFAGSFKDRNKKMTSFQERKDKKRRERKKEEIKISINE